MEAKERCIKTLLRSRHDQYFGSAVAASPVATVVIGEHFLRSDDRGATWNEVPVPEEPGEARPLALNWTGEAFVAVGDGFTMTNNDPILVPGKRR